MFSKEFNGGGSTTGELRVQGLRMRRLSKGKVESLSNFAVVEILV